MGVPFHLPIERGRNTVRRATARGIPGTERADMRLPKQLNESRPAPSRFL